MNKRLLCTVIALALAAPALAQPANRGGGGFRDGDGFRGDRGDRPERPQRGRMLDRLTEELDLSEDQREEIRQIAESHFQQMRENREAAGEGQGFGSRRGGFGPEGREALADAISEVLNEDQQTRFAEMRERMRQNGPGRRGDPRRMIENLPDELEMTDEQLEHYDIVVQDFQAKMEERRAHFEEMRPVFAELRAARDAGDEARVEELRAQLDANRPERGELMRNFRADLEQFLSAEQIEKLDGLMQRGGPRGERGPGRRSDIVTDARTMLQAMQRVGLTQDQQATAKQIAQDTQKKLREIDRRDRESIEQLNKETKEQIVAMLTESQKERFEQLLQRNARPQRGDRGPGFDRGQRGERGQRGGRRGPATETDTKTEPVSEPETETP